MKYSIVSRRSFISRVPKYLILPLIVLCFSVSFNLSAQAQLPSQLVCQFLDDFENTELPGNDIELDSGDPGPVNVLDNGSPGVLGDIRNITYGPISGLPNDEARLIIEVGKLSNNNEGVESSAPLTLIYDADGQGVNVDLSNNQGFFFTLTSNDLPGTFLEITLQDSSSNSAVRLFELPVIPILEDEPIDIDLQVSSFNGIGSLDLSDIQRIEFSFNSNVGTPDYAFTSIEICEPRPVNIPTLSEWGLIAIAGVLGIAGFLVIRRRNLLST